MVNVMDKEQITKSRRFERGHGVVILSSFTVLMGIFR